GRQISTRGPVRIYFSGSHNAVGPAFGHGGTRMAIENLGEPHLGPTSIPESERKAWPSHQFVEPKRIAFTSAKTVTNEVYFRRSTAYKRGAELLGTSVFYMVYHLGVVPDSTFFSTYGAGIVVADDEAGASDEGAGLYHDACNGKLLVEHVKDGEAKLEVQVSGKTRIIDTVAHFHVAGYGAPDEYSSLDLDKLFQHVYEDTGAAGQRDMISSFGKGTRQ